MHKMQEIEQQFRELNESIVKEYEDELYDLKKQQERRQKKLQEDEKEVRDILQSSKIDVDRLEKLEHKDANDLKKYLKDNRPKMIDRPTRLPLDFKERSVYDSISSQACSTTVKPYSASLLAPQKNLIKHVQGESGNPWILPYNPEEINILQNSEGSGWGCWAEGKPLPVRWNVWFNFVPDETSVWDLIALFGFHGFYILKAHDGLFTCKEAEVFTEVKMNVYQYFWHGWKNFNLIDKDDDNIELTKFYDSGQLFDYTTNLKAGDSTWVLVQVSVRAYASGGGSYAEINFSDGAANYIKPFLLAAGAV
ncbi:MAG: hypothetical protein PVG35_22860 [Desulfobacterales bacterium]